MARYRMYPRYRRYRRYGGRYWRRNWWRRGVRSSQQSGTRKFSIVIPVQGYGSTNVGATLHESTSFGFQAFYNSDSVAGAQGVNRFGNLIQSDLFTTYCNLYDEVKINSCSIQLVVTGLPEGNSGVKVISAVDRHCTVDDIRGLRTAANLSTSSESDTRMFSSLNNARVWRYFRARDMQERTVYVDSSYGSRQYTVGGVTYNIAGLLEFLDTGSLYGAFNPITVFAFELSNAPNAAATVSFQYRVSWNLTFRNPKYGLSGLSKSGLGSDGRLDTDGFSVSDLPDVDRGIEDDEEDEDLDEETLKKLKAFLLKDVQLPLKEEEKKDEMEDDEKGS